MSFLMTFVMAFDNFNGILKMIFENEFFLMTK